MTTFNMETNILKVLQKQVTESVTASGSPPVKYINRNFTIPENGKWWEIVYIPNNIPNSFWDEGKIYQGVLRLILHWPQDNSGAYNAMNEVVRVSDYFQKGSIFQDDDENVNVKITDHPDVLAVIEKAPEVLIPLTIRYSCFKI